MMLSLTEISLHKRNITHYGLTTLRSTVAFNLLQVAKPQPGELIMDPMCGSGAIPIEVMINFSKLKHSRTSCEHIVPVLGLSCRLAFCGR